jgi:hypothetical protein
VQTEQVRRSPARVTFRAWRNWEPAALETDPSLHISESFNPSTWEPAIPVRGRHAFLGVYAKGLPEDSTIKTVRIHLGSVGVIPIFVGESEFPGYKQINAAVPPGLEPGTAKLWIEERGKRSNEIPIHLTEGNEW